MSKFIAIILFCLSFNSYAGLSPSAFLTIQPATIDSSNNSVTPVTGAGSWFSMSVSPSISTFVSIKGRKQLHLGTVQAASTGALSFLSNLDFPWSTFGNIGVHKTTSSIVVLSDDLSGNVTLDFSGWAVSWNGIPSISLGTGPDNGVATMVCFSDFSGLVQGTCAVGEQYVLDYRATVSTTDISGKSGTEYVLHLEGVISDTQPVPTNLFSVISIKINNIFGDDVPFTVGDTAMSAGNLTGVGLSFNDIGVSDPFVNPSDGAQCVGGCIDFIANNIQVSGGFVELVVKLTANIPANAVYRKLVNGVWQNFDTSAGDLIRSATMDSSGNCPISSGTFDAGLKAGNQCLYLKIEDGGPNDDDGVANNTVVDPGGIAVAGSTVSSGSINGFMVLFIMLFKFIRYYWKQRNVVV